MIISYKIYVIFYQQDIPTTDYIKHYMFQNLKPNQNYSINVTMRNGVGEGPPAIVYIFTTREPTGTLRKNVYIYNNINKNADITQIFLSKSYRLLINFISLLFQIALFNYYFKKLKLRDYRFSLRLH